MIGGAMLNERLYDKIPKRLLIDGWIDNTIDKRKNRCLQNTTQIIKDRVTGTLLIIVG
jgi:hypothetical protein